MKFSANMLQVYFICGTQDVRQDTTLKNVLTEALEAGITLFQFREKGDKALKGDDKEQLAIELQHLCHQFKVPFIVNDDVELALRINADGIHVGQDDDAISTFIERCDDKIIGLSISDEQEYQHSDLSEVDYIGVGPMYDTPSKKDAHPPVGPAMITKLKSYNSHMPIVAIGGITVSNTQNIVKAGADGISVISAISKSDNITQTVKDFRGYFNN
ncbi:thiamine phosphate synthase [Staphylococcus simiae]|uniref:thiamine phosphate synthase n=1 Tax=Staphylococcus simiae TaxID=308354 RepID=UPI001A95AD57|nr:thiamine phosphate synthase [Staphylococcus simiae]MBO1199709.1 thiamine phosphate synthase [Staphylococcus simiae]MBO1201990.1 thiamine phosphate synthase [Staphylococcus simiae]MBO1204226.1 thiamine phosphate synthase [Staphylococcus simiae]MBO1211725.1 thiamine phosphate synthase [Staphylococcus simiae]MBO1230118.1 thiamine phosphate synthase [Staphylococcus simiae]